MVIAQGFLPSTKVQPTCDGKIVYSNAEILHIETL